MQEQVRREKKKIAIRILYEKKKTLPWRGEKGTAAKTEGEEKNFLQVQKEREGGRFTGSIALQVPSLSARSKEMSSGKA